MQAPTAIKPGTARRLGLADPQRYAKLAALLDAPGPSLAEMMTAYEQPLVDEIGARMADFDGAWREAIQKVAGAGTINWPTRIPTPTRESRAEVGQRLLLDLRMDTRPES